LQAAPLDDRHAAIERALNFLYKTASDDAAFSRFGEDLLWCFYTISHTAADHDLSESARTMGREMAGRWRKSHRHVPPDASATRIFLLLSSADAADRLGFPDRRYKSELRKASAKFTVIDFLSFDPAHGPPSMDNPGRYDQWYGAMIVLEGTKFLISTQRPDGSWAGDPDDLYTEYHSAWAGIDGLRDYHFHGQVKRLPVH
jgi:hypothetical protein